LPVFSISRSSPSAGLLHQIEEWLDDVDRHRKHDGRILLGADLGQRLQVAQLHGGRNARQTGMLDRIVAALASVCEAWNSASA
jgi:hypothetical protein